MKDHLCKRGQPEVEREPIPLESDFEQLAKRKEPHGVLVDNPAWRKYMRYYDVWEGDDDAD